jgi:hypothetical protein
MIGTTSNGRPKYSAAGSEMNLVAFEMEAPGASPLVLAQTRPQVCKMRRVVIEKCPPDMHFSWWED